MTPCLAVTAAVDLTTDTGRYQGLVRMFRTLVKFYREYCRKLEMVPTIIDLMR